MLRKNFLRPMSERITGMRVSKIFALTLISILAVAPAFGATGQTISVATDAPASSGGSISADATGGSVSLNAKSLLLRNDGTNEVYIRVNSLTAATTSDFSLEANEEILIRAADNNRILKLSYICAATETATVRYLAWD